MSKTYEEPKKLAELQPGVRNFCGDFNARKPKMRWVDAALIHSFLNEKRNVEFQIRLPIFVWHQHNNQQWFSAFRLSSFYQFLKFRIEILLTYILRSCISSEEKKRSNLKINAFFCLLGIVPKQQILDFWRDDFTIFFPCLLWSKKLFRIF